MSDLPSFSSLPFSPLACPRALNCLVFQIWRLPSFRRVFFFAELFHSTNALSFPQRCTVGTIPALRTSFPGPRVTSYPPPYASVSIRPCLEFAGLPSNNFSSNPFLTSSPFPSLPPNPLTTRTRRRRQQLSLNAWCWLRPFSPVSSNGSRSKH